MINKEKLRIVSSCQIAKYTVEMVLENDYISKHATPGQFVHLTVDGHTLRRPISIADINREQQTITILFKIIGSGTKRLAAYQVGEYVDALGPSGNGFQLENHSGATILLVGGGIGVPPLYNLGKALAAKGINIISVLGFQTGDYVFYEGKFKALGQTIIVTNDGSYGEKGFVTDVLDDLDFDRYYTCGPVPMLQAITTKLKGKDGYISLEERMGCGVGACFACVIPVNDGNGYKKICKDGPVFHAEEVAL